MPIGRMDLISDTHSTEYITSWAFPIKLTDVIGLVYCNFNVGVMLMVPEMLCYTENFPLGDGG